MSVALMNITLTVGHFELLRLDGHWVYYKGCSG